MLLIDSHCHLNKLNFRNVHKNIWEVIEKARKKDVKILLTVCTNLIDLKEIKSMIDVDTNVDGIFFSCGVHPSYVDNSFNIFDLYQASKNTEKIIAIGETGLDYFYQGDRKKQKEAFSSHIQIGKLLKKPIIVHSRHAKKDTISMLRSEQAEKCGGILHCFNENKSFARKLLDLNFFLSFSGIVTFHNAQHLKEIVKYVPFEHILLETDSPYLSPVPYRGMENQPAYLRETAIYIAKLKKISLRKLAKITSDNFFSLFRLKNNLWES